MEIAATVLIALGVLLDMLAAHGYLADNALLAMALALKVVSVALPMDGWPYVLSGLCGSWLWFCLGMAFCLHTHAHAERFLPRLLGTSRLSGVAPLRGNVAIVGVAWLALSVVASLSGFAGTKAGAALLTLVGLAWFTSIFATAFAGGRSSRLFAAVGKVTIGIFLLHPICLNVLFHLLDRHAVHGAVAFLLALVAAYAAPVAIQWVLDHVGKLGFLLKPVRYLPAVQQH